MKKRSRFLGRALAIFLLMLVVAVVGFVLWGSTPLGPSAEAVAALRSDGSVVVTDAQWLTFAPASTTPVAGLVFYPGGRVDSRAYAPSARALAARGLLVVIVPMPLNLAVFAPGRAAEVIAAHPEVAVWAVGGHSLGGAMAAAFAGSHPDAVEGLVLWAAYPASGNGLSGRDDLAVLSVYATLDGLMTEAERTASASLLPGTACWVALDGGNHAQFGSYGVQRGDHPATLSAAAQQGQIVNATAAFLLGLPAFAGGGGVMCP